MEAVARELIGCDVLPDIAVFGGLGKQVPNEVADVLLRLGDALVAMKESRELVVAVPAGVMGDALGDLLLRLKRRSGPGIEISSVLSVGALHELARRLAGELVDEQEG